MSKFLRALLNLKHILLIMIIVMLNVGTMFLFNDEINYLNNYLGFLNTRNYSYSVLVDRSISKDTYAFYDRQITFSTNNKMTQSINCTIFMESNNEHSENDFFYPFDSSSLKKDEIALSQNLLNYYHLCVGDTIFSKHIVKNEVVSYRVKQQLPAVYGIGEKDFKINNGIALLGFDQLYISNINTDYMFFYKDDSSLINKENVQIIGNLVSKVKTKNNVIILLSKDYLISILIYLCISLTYTSLLLAFNRKIYFIKKRFGNSDTYSFFNKASLLYEIFVLIFSLLVYILFGLCNYIVLQQIVIFSISSMVPNVIMNLIFLKKLERI